MMDRQIEKELNRQMVLFDEECRGSSLTDGHIKFETFALQWQQEYVEKALGKRTQANYKQLLLYAAIGHLYMDKITPRQIQKFINSLSEPGANQTHGDRGLSPKSVKNHLSVISAVFAYAIKMGMLQYNPCRAVTLPPLEEKVGDSRLVIIRPTFVVLGVGPAALGLRQMSFRRGFVNLDLPA